MAEARTGRTVRPAPRRERARAATIDEIKRTALDLMREHGTVEVKFTDIARAMEMTPPALYRYFADRDQLLHALIADAYNDLGDAVQRARDGVPADDLGGRWLAVAEAYRHWARREPHQFALILGLPVSGYAAPESGPTTEAAQRAMAQLSTLFIDALMAGRLQPPLVREVAVPMEMCAVAKMHDMHGSIPPDTFQAMLHAWAALHGITSLEAYGHLDWMEPAARDALFLGQAKLVARFTGLPEPPG